jgi:hypothetical protein
MPARQWRTGVLHLMQRLNQEIVNDHTKDIGHRSNRHDRRLHGQTDAHGQGDRMKDLLTRALEAHGGLSRWREIEAFQLKVSIGGGLWRLKGLPDGLRDVTLRILAHRPMVTITPFGGEARTGHFTPDRVWIEDANGGVVEERATPRASFAGHVLTTPWDKLQELYFVSYALWNYLATPFVFTEPGFETREIGPHEENGETWHRLLVKYPPSIPTHCAEQVLYFNAQGLLQRMDYSVDVVGDMVAGAASHYCFDHTPFGGIVIPTLRRAVSRTPKGAVLSGPTGVLLQMSDIKLIPNAPKEKNNDR